MGVRISDFLPLDPRISEHPPLLDSARVLPRVLSDPVRVSSGFMDGGTAGRITSYDFRRDGDVLPVLHRVPFLPGRRSTVCVRWGSQHRDRRVAGAFRRLAARSWRLVGRRVSILPRRRLGRRYRNGLALLAATWPRAVAVYCRSDPGCGIRPVSLCGGRACWPDGGGVDAGGHADCGSGAAAASGGWRLRRGGGVVMRGVP